VRGVGNGKRLAGRLKRRECGFPFEGFRHGRVARSPSPATVLPLVEFTAPAGLVCARLPGSLGSPVPACPRRFRRDYRFVPRAVRRSLALTASSPRLDRHPARQAARDRLFSPPALASRELRSPSESSVSYPPSLSPAAAPSMGFTVPLRDITGRRPCSGNPSSRGLSVRGVSHAPDGLLRHPARGFVSPHCHVQGLLFRGCCLASSRADSSSALLCPLVVGAASLTMLPPPPRTVVPTSGLCSTRESVAAASAINRCAGSIPS
jgi:hypothetical protein